MTKTIKDVLNDFRNFDDTGDFLTLDQALKEIEAIHQQEIAKEINKALLLQYEMDLANLPKYDIIHDLPEDYIAARKLSLEVSIETLKEHKEE